VAVTSAAAGWTAYSISSGDRKRGNFTAGGFPVQGILGRVYILAGFPGHGQTAKMTKLSPGFSLGGPLQAIKRNFAAPAIERVISPKPA
jgi:hypothetical protein